MSKYTNIHISVLRIQPVFTVFGSCVAYSQVCFLNLLQKILTIFLIFSVLLFLDSSQKYCWDFQALFLHRHLTLHLSLNGFDHCAQVFLLSEVWEKWMCIESCCLDLISIFFCLISCRIYAIWFNTKSRNIILVFIGIEWSKKFYAYRLLLFLKMFSFTRKRAHWL